MKVTALGLSFGLAICALILPATASADDGRRSINSIERQEQSRIRQGIRSGELTRREAARLEAEQARIRVNERFQRLDGGGLTVRERERLHRELHQASRHIYHQKHDRQDRN